MEMSISFGADPLQVAGIVAVGKHFPGHGDTVLDSHVGLAIGPHARARLDVVEFVPFRAAIAAGVALHGIGPGPKGPG